MSFEAFEKWLFGKKDQIAFLEQWHTCAEFGLTTKNFCQKLVDSGSSSTKKIGQAGLDAPGQGLQFADVLEGWLPEVVVSTLILSEQNGQLKAGLEVSIKELQGGQGVMMNLLRFTLVPLLTFFALGALGVVVSGEIIASAQLERSIASTWREMVSGPGLILACTVLGLLVASAMAMPIWTGPVRHLFDKLPLFTHYRYAVAGNLLATLSNVLQAGMNLSQAIEAITPRSTRYLKQHLARMEATLETVSNPGIVFNTGLLLRDSQINLEVVGDIAPLPRLLTKAAEQHHTHSQKQFTRLQEWLPKIILMLGAVLLLSLVGLSIGSLFMSIKL